MSFFTLSSAVLCFSLFYFQCDHGKVLCIWKGARYCTSVLASSVDTFAVIKAGSSFLYASKRKEARMGREAERTRLGENTEVPFSGWSEGLCPRSYLLAVLEPTNSQLRKKDLGAHCPLRCCSVALCPFPWFACLSAVSSVTCVSLRVAHTLRLLRSLLSFLKSAVSCSVLSVLFTNDTVYQSGDLAVWHFSHQAVSSLWVGVFSCVIFLLSKVCRIRCTVNIW